MIPEIAGHFPHLTDEQNAVIEHVSGPLAVIAGPGSGKTTTVILRAINLLASGLARPQDLVITTFSREAARDLRNRFCVQAQAIRPDAQWSEVQITTIHGVCQNLLRRHGQRIVAPGFRTLDALGRVAFLDSRLFDITTKRQRAMLSRRWGTAAHVVRGLAQAFDQIVEQSVDVRDLASAADPLHRAVGALYLEYEAALREAGLADFAHLLGWARDLLDDPDWAHVGDEGAYAMVDEYQDTTPLQAEIFRRWTAGSGNLMVVGDDDQSIYAFRGARPDSLREFAQGAPGCRTIHLSVNHRSHAGIAEATSRWMRDIVGEERGDCVAEEVASDGSDRDRYPGVMVVEGAGPEDEAQRLAVAFRHLREDGVVADYGQIALLLHSVRDQVVAPYRDGLRAQGIPHVVRQRVKLMDHPAVKLMVGCLAIIFDGVQDAAFGPPSGNGAFRRYLRDAEEHVRASTAPDTPLGRALTRWPAQLREAAAKGTVLDRNLHDYCYALMAVEPFCRLAREPAATRVLAGWSRCVQTFHDHYGHTEITGDGIEALKRDLFGRFLPLVHQDSTWQPAEEGADGGAVQIMTVHQSKGLEFPVTAVASLAHNPDPNRPDLDLSGFAAEQPTGTGEACSELDQARCKYVGFTRAADLLLLSGHGEPAPTVRAIWHGAPRWSPDGRRSLAGQRFQRRPAASGKPSYSVTGDLAQYRLCPRRYRYFSREGFVQPATQQSALGSLVHRSIDAVHRRVLGGLPLDDRAVREIVSRESASTPAHRGRALRQVRRYARDNEKNFGGIIGSETPLRADLGGFIMTGRTDLITRQGDGLAVTDIKTGRLAAGDRERQAAYRDQLMLYAHLVAERYRQPVVRASLYWTDAPEGSDAVQSFAISKWSVAEALRRAARTAGRISAGDFAIRQPPPAGVCNGCALRSICRRDGTIVPEPVPVSAGGKVDHQKVGGGPAGKQAAPPVRPPRRAQLRRAA